MRTSGVDDSAARQREARVQAEQRELARERQREEANREAIEAADARRQRERELAVA